VDALPTEVDGCRELRLAPAHDQRGSFLKVFAADAFAALGIDLPVAEIFLSRSKTGVVRGLHYQRPPADVAKLVWCLDGEVVDVVVDLRDGSPTRHRHAVVHLSSERANAVFVPEGCAHGFLVTRGEAVVGYAQSGPHDPVLEAGVLWSSAGIEWPVDPDVLQGVILSERDAAFPTLAELQPDASTGGS
jgi:dTDP-4-dehydrorhamnose 3,5-epimerase